MSEPQKRDDGFLSSEYISKKVSGLKLNEIEKVNKNIVVKIETPHATIYIEDSEKQTETVIILNQFSITKIIDGYKRVAIRPTEIYLKTLKGE